MKSQILDALAISLILVAVMFSIGCSAREQSAKTEAIYEDGPRKISYISTKEQQGLILDIGLDDAGHIKSVRIRADKSTTNDESVASSTLINLRLLDLVQGLVAAGAKTGGS